MSLYNEYRPKTLEEMVGNEATIKAIREHFTQSDPKRVSHCHLLSGPAGCGKAQPLYSKVLTPSGWKAMGDVHAGDTVLSGEGTPTEVLSVFPQGKRPVYAIGLDDGTEVEVADNHLNVVKYRARGKYHGEVCYADCTDVVTTLDLIDMVNAANRSRNKYRNGIRIPNVYVEGPESSDLPIDPYLLGVLIGDGCLNSAFNVSLPEADVRIRVESLLKDEGFVLHKSNPNDPEDYDYRIVHDTERYERVQDLKDDPDSLRNRIRDMELDVKSVDKHIPEEYLLASYKDRLELLRGLFDTDGSVAVGMSKGRYETISYEFSTSSERLSRDFASLVRSLGITDTVKSRVPYYKDANGNRVECHINYRHHLKVPNGLLIAHSDKHLARIKDRECGESLSRRIRYVRYVGDVECQCIYVKAECHTYITDNHTLTHNTTIARAIATELLGCDPQFNITEINTADNRGIDTVRELMEQMRMMPLNGKPWAIVADEAHGMTADAKRAFLKPAEECPDHVFFFFCTTNLQQFLKGDEGKALGTRCTQWKLEPLAPRQLGRLVDDVAAKEKFDLDADVLSAIVDSADGSPRAALVALEKVMSTDGKEKQLKLLEGFTNDDPDTLALCRALCSPRPSWGEVSKILKGMKGKVDSETVRRAVLGYCTSVILNKGDKGVARVLEEFSVDTYATGFPGLVLAAYRALQ